MLRKLAVMGISIFTVASCGPKLEPQEPCNFVMNSQSQRVSWKDQTPVVMYIHRSVPTQYHQAIQQALDSWNASIGRPIFSVGGIIDGDGNPSREGISGIYWLNSWDSERRDEQGRTTIFWAGAQIKEADIRINARDFTYSTGSLSTASVDFKSLILHEMGHVLGLSHNTQEGSVMNPRLANGVDRSTPGHKDVSSLQCEY